MNEKSKVSRRTALATMAGATGAVITAGTSGAQDVQPNHHKGGRLKQSVCKWCYPKIALDDLCREAAAMGIKSVELLGENDWDTPKKYGMTCAMPTGITGISDGWNNPARHDAHVQEAERLLPLAKKSGLINFIVFSGNRDAGLSDKDGLENCVKGLKRITPLAEQLGITVCMELLNSKRDHKGYMCDHTVWGVELCKRVGSERFKLLYDIYHMQIMEGDVIKTIQDNKEFLAHFHTGGVPGRAEIDETQELNYQTIAQAIVDTGFQGYFAHEFIPRRSPIASLKQAVGLCDV